MELHRRPLIHLSMGRRLPGSLQQRPSAGWINGPPLTQLDQPWIGLLEALQTTTGSGPVAGGRMRGMAQPSLGTWKGGDQPLLMKPAVGWQQMATRTGQQLQVLIAGAAPMLQLLTVLAVAGASLTSDGRLGKGNHGSFQGWGRPSQWPSAPLIVGAPLPMKAVLLGAMGKLTGGGLLVAWQAPHLVPEVLLSQQQLQLVGAGASLLVGAAVSRVPLLGLLAQA
mmetsp:Transcript_34376/g.76337  ORF Transcript_34376/g.76337 Transcript_34376/m.76337 type:complete len:224 (+) Transcript_34376:248-919(+)